MGPTSLDRFLKTCTAHALPVTVRAVVYDSGLDAHGITARRKSARSLLRGAGRCAASRSASAACPLSARTQRASCTRLRSTVSSTGSCPSRGASQARRPRGALCCCSLSRDQARRGRGRVAPATGSRSSCAGSRSRFTLAVPTSASRTTCTSSRRAGGSASVSAESFQLTFLDLRGRSRRTSSRACSRWRSIRGTRGTTSSTSITRGGAVRFDRRVPSAELRRRPGICARRWSRSSHPLRRTTTGASGCSGPAGGSISGSATAAGGGIPATTRSLFARRGQALPDRRQPAGGTRR